MLWARATAAFDAATNVFTCCLCGCCSLPVLVTLHLLQNHDSKAGGEDAPAWWHKHAAAMGSGGGGGGAGAAYGGKLVGGSRQMPQLDKCAQCDVDRPAYRCKGCSSVAFCSRDCQKANWLAGHKRECSKLRKQLQQQVRLEAAEAAAAAGNSLALPAESKARDSKDRPVESNSTPPVPLKVSKGLLWLLVAAGPLSAMAVALKQSAHNPVCFPA